MDDDAHDRAADPGRPARPDRRADPRPRRCRSQTELAELLAGDGVQVTQATLSRDLEELGAVKVRGDGGPRLPDPEDGNRPLRRAEQARPG